MKNDITDDYLKTILNIIPKFPIYFSKRRYMKRGCDLSKKEIAMLKGAHQKIIPTEVYHFTVNKPVYPNHLLIMRGIAEEKGLKGLEKYVLEVKENHLKYINHGKN